MFELFSCHYNIVQPQVLFLVFFSSSSSLSLFSINLVFSSITLVDTSIENTCVADARGMWSGAPTGEYRVKNVEIYNRETACYEPLDLEKEYLVAGSNYLLCNNGGGLTMFEKAEKTTFNAISE